MAGIFGGFQPDNTLGALFLTPPKGNEAYWRQRLANQGSISKARPTLGQRMEGAVTSGLRKAGVSNHNASRIGSKTFSAVNDLTPVGNLTGAQEGGSQFLRGVTRGDLGSAALGAGVFGLSVLPGPMQKVGKGMFGRLLKDEAGAIRAWHGSPHDFDRFSLSKIGTGEGAQAYGHGLYFAENPAVAQAYQNNLAGVEFASGDSVVDRMLSETFKDLTATRMGPVTARDAANVVEERLSRQRTDALKAQDFEWFDQISDQRNALRRIVKDPPKPKGRLYEVNIDAEPEDFLDWDAPIAHQAPQVRDMLADIYGASGTGADAYRLAADDARTIAIERGRNALTTAPAIQMQASQGLLGMGIPGLRYLDQGSRAAADGTRNYVVFDDNLVNILNKY